MKALTERIQLIVAELRESGLNISSKAIADALDIIVQENVFSLRDFKLVLRASLIKNSNDFNIFEVMFRKYFPEFYGGRYDPEEVKKEIERTRRRKDELRAESENNVFIISDIEDEISSLDPNDKEYKKYMKQLEVLKKRQKEIERKLKDLSIKQRELIEKRRRINNIVQMAEEMRRDFNEYLRHIRGGESILDSEEEQFKKDLDSKTEKPKGSGMVESPEISGAGEPEQELGGEGRESRSWRHRGGEPSGSGVSGKPRRQPSGSGRKLMGGRKYISGKHKHAEEIGEAEYRYLIEQEEEEMRSVLHEILNNERPPDKERIGNIEPRTGLRDRSNASIGNNKLFRNLLKEISSLEMKELLDGNIELLKKMIEHELGEKLLTDDKAIHKYIDNLKKRIKDAISKQKVDEIEMRELFREILRRLNKLKNYDYRRQVILQKLGMRHGIDIKKLDFKKDLKMLSKYDQRLYNEVMNRLKRNIRKLADLFKLKKARRYKETRGGQLDITRTFSYNIPRYGGVIADMKYKTFKRKKANLFVLCDISGSVQHISELFYVFLNAARKAFKNLIVYAFVKHIVRVNSIADMRKYASQHRISDMRTAYHELLKLKIPNSYVLLILTDCRTNDADRDKTMAIPKSYESLARMNKLLKHVIVLNPEREEEWGVGGDSPSAKAYIRVAKVPVFEFYNIETLEHAIKYIGKIV